MLRLEGSATIGRFIGRAIMLASVILVASLLWGCGSLERTADTAYGAYSITVQVAADVMKSPEVSDSVKLKIQTADRVAFPYGQGLYSALLKCKTAPPLLKKEHCAGDLQSALDLSREAFTAYAAAVLPESPKEK